MSDFTRRSVMAASALLAGGAVSAQGAENQPADLSGTVQGGKVTLPSLHQPSEGSETLDEPLPPSKRLGVAVVGIGHLALEQILPGFAQAKSVRLAALVSSSRDKALAIADQHGVAAKNIYDYAHFDDLKNNPDVDAVYIVLPNSMHAEYTVRAAQAGKHVLCEKPMATNVVEAQQMIDACRQANRKLMIAYRMQYSTPHRALIEMIRNKDLGDLRLIEAVNGQNDAPNGQWRQNKAMAGGGSLPDVGIYCLNAFRYITGEEPIEVTGHMMQSKDDPRFREIENVANFTLTFPSGVLAVGTSGYSMHESRRLRANGSTGWIDLDPAFAYDNLAMRIGRRIGAANSVEQRMFAPKNQFSVEMDHFAEAIRADRQPHTPGEEGLQDQKIMAAIYEAAASRSVVKLTSGPNKLDATRGPLPG